MSITSLTPYVAPEVMALIRKWVSPYAVHFVITRARQSKHGDFRAGRGRGQSIITLNQDLSPLQFLLTLTHEIAHLMVWHRHGRRAAPHGRAWKDCFSELLNTLSQETSLPSAFCEAIRAHAKRPTAASSRDINLMRVLQKLEGAHTIWLADLALGDSFLFRGHPFVKIKNNRTRCKCRHLGNGALYHISKTAVIERYTSNDSKSCTS